jgi:serine/threonine-protein kinase
MSGVDETIETGLAGATGQAGGTDQLWAGPGDDPDRYALYHVVGGGAEGKVYRATRALRDGHLDVAVKVMLPDRFGAHGEPAEQVAERWSAQAARLRNLRHPGLVGVQEAFLGPAPHPAGVDAAGNNYAYFVMAWVEGQELGTWAGRQSTALARLGVLENVADALDELHENGQVHADVKPGNVVVRSTTLPTGATVEAGVLVDFGVMRAITGTRPSQVAFTAGYAAPELWQGAPYGPASDLYALAGVVLWALTGDHPAVAQDAAADARARLAAAGLSPDAVEAVAAALQPDPALRPALGCRAWLSTVRGGLSSSASAMTLPVGAVTAPTGAVAPAPGTGGTAPAGLATGVPDAPRRRRSPGRLVVTAVVLAGLLLVGGGAYALAQLGVADPGGTEAGEAPGTMAEATTTTERERRERSTTTTTEGDAAFGDPADLVGEDLEHAREALTDEGFTVEVDETLDAEAGDGEIVSAEEAADGTVVLTVARPPVTRYLADLEPVDNYVETGLRSISGEQFTRSLFLVAACSSDPEYVEYDLGRDYRQLQMTIGLDDESPSGLRTRFEVFVDGSRVTNVDHGLGEAEPITLDVTDVLRVRFQSTVLDPSNCGYGGGSVFADARLLGVPSEVPPDPNSSDATGTGTLDTTTTTTTTG